MFRLPGLSANAPLLFFTLKVAAGFGLWAVYTFYYPDKSYADIWKFFDDSAIIHEALKESPADYFSMVSGIGIDDRIEQTYLMRMNHWHQPFESNLFNDSHTIIRFNAVVRLISGGNYHVHTVVMCLLAFLGLAALYRWIYSFIPQWKKVIAGVLFVLPSLLFWSSGVLKEGLMLFSLGIIIEQTWKFLKDKNIRRLAFIMPALFLLAITKLYMLAFLLPALLLAWWLKTRPGFTLVKFAAVLLLILSFGKILEWKVPELSPARIIALKHNDFVRLAHGGTYMYNDTVVVYLEAERRSHLVCSNGDSCTLESNVPFRYWRINDNFADTFKSAGNQSRVNYKILTDIPKAGSIIDNSYLGTDFKSMAAGLPRAICNAILRPLPWEGKSLLILPSVLENLFLIVLTIAAAFFFKRPSARHVLWFCMLFAFISLSVIGLTTPVLGAIVRYRITALPFLFIALLMIIDREKLIRKWPVLARFL
jgi:hypothetical protein